jgi:uncharacterized membrane protein YoaK (UPF0700 family)
MRTQQFPMRSLVGDVAFRPYSLAVSTNMPPLLPAEAVHSKRHLLVWLALAFSAGATNAATLAACQRFVTHVTGTLTRIGADFGDFRLLIDYILIAVAFVFGAMASVIWLDGRRFRGLDPLPAVPMLLVALATAAAAILGGLGFFGPFGVTVETDGDFELLVMLSFAMGLQNAAIATTTGMVVRTTHMTGPVTDASIAAATWLVAKNPLIRSAAWRSIWLRSSKVAMFVIGGAAAWFLAKHLEYAVFYIPAFIAFCSAFAVHHLVRAQRTPKPTP